MTKDRIEVDTGTTDRVALIELNSSEHVILAEFAAPAGRPTSTQGFVVRAPKPSQTML